MKKINLKGITAEAVTGVLVLAVALINAILQMFGVNALPIENNEVSEIVSTLFLIATTLYNVYKNRNIFSLSHRLNFSITHSTWDFLIPYPIILIIFDIAHSQIT